jgi:general L-amino acid transport system permease protein
MDAVASEKIPFWHNPTVRGIFYQVMVVCLFALLAWYLVTNTLHNLHRQNIATGFGFLTKRSSFEIGESLISYSSVDTYGRALLVGALNTLKVSFVGVIITLILGTIIGLSRLSANWLVSRMATLYIEVMQNIPVLLQLFFWYAIFYESLPPPRRALNPVSGVFLSNRGLIVAVPQWHQAHLFMLLTVGLAIVLTFLLRGWAKRRQALTGRHFPVFWASVAMNVGLPVAVWLGFGAPIRMSVPHLVGFNFQGGITFSPEFIALLLGLVLYTAAFVAEVVRAGVQSVSKGQTEAAMALGLRSRLVLNLVILPQALRVIVPPLTSQMLNLTKNSSLAVAIGFPDFVSVANTTINQTGQSIEGVALIMVVYLIFSLSTSAFMNWYNKKTKLIER